VSPELPCVSVSFVWVSVWFFFNVVCGFWCGLCGSLGGSEGATVCPWGSLCVVFGLYLLWFLERVLSLGSAYCASD